MGDYEYQIEHSNSLEELSEKVNDLVYEYGHTETVDDSEFSYADEAYCLKQQSCKNEYPFNHLIKIFRLAETRKKQLLKEFKKEKGVK